MSTLREAAQQALRDLERAEATGACEYASTAALRAAMAQQEQEQADYPEDKLHAVAQYVSNQYHVWYGVNARDIEEVLRQSVRCGLVSNPPRREWQSLSMGEALKLWGMRSDGPSNGEIAGFARAIEQALKEKNQ